MQQKKTVRSRGSDRVAGNRGTIRGGNGVGSRGNGGEQGAGGRVRGIGNRGGPVKGTKGETGKPKRGNRKGETRFEGKGKDQRWKQR